MTVVIPELKGKLDGMAMLIPTPDVSVVDFVCEITKETSADEINKAMKRAAEGKLKKYLEYTEEELVSKDFVGASHSSIFDAKLTRVLDGKMVKVIAWYETNGDTRAALLI